MKIRIPEVVKIDGGKFWMGSRQAPYPSEAPYHKVAVKTFYLGQFLVTEEEFKDFVIAKRESITEFEEDLNYSPKGCNPANDISWIEAASYCDWLAHVTGKAFRLPTEAEWEYAAKGGKALKYPTSTGDISRAQANYGNHIRHVTSVGTYRPNPFGLYDMAGNVWEWCNSKKGDYSGEYCIHSYNYPYDNTDGREDTRRSGASRILRGGCYSNRALHCRSAARYREFEYRSSNYHPSRGKNSFGFRVAMSG
jgi:formylglycine-generating enzyme required for sulfatase activity